MIVSMTDTARRPGRPRDAGAEAAIRDAVRAVLVEVGFGGLTVDAVAAHAGVGKATIYRRWRSKEELVRAALGEILEDEEPPDTGSLAGDLRAILRVMVRDASGVKGQLMPALCGEAQTDPELAEILASFSGEKRRVFDAVFDRAVARGELEPGVDVEVCTEVLLGPVLARRLITRGALDDAFADKVVEIVVSGLAVR
jgi:AcrR family transcriptional regulator